jgi:hypothetical protein
MNLSSRSHSNKHPLIWSPENHSIQPEIQFIASNLICITNGCTINLLSQSLIAIDTKSKKHIFWIFCTCNFSFSPNHARRRIRVDRFCGKIVEIIFVCINKMPLQITFVLRYLKEPIFEV